VQPGSALWCDVAANKRCWLLGHPSPVIHAKAFRAGFVCIQRLTSPFHACLSVCRVCRVPCAVCRVPCAVCRVPCSVCRVPCAVCRVPCAVCRVPFATTDEAFPCSFCATVAPQQGFDPLPPVCTSGSVLQVNVSVDGLYTVTVLATDAAGNVGVPALVSFRRDTEAPVSFAGVDLAALPAGGTVLVRLGTASLPEVGNASTLVPLTASSVVVVSVTCSEACRSVIPFTRSDLPTVAATDVPTVTVVAGSGGTAFTLVYSALSEGTHVVSAGCVDFAGFVDPAPPVVAFVVNAVGPTTVLLGPPPALSARDTVNMTLAARGVHPTAPVSFALTGWQYRQFPSGAPSEPVPPLPAAVLASAAGEPVVLRLSDVRSGLYRVRIVAADAVGNVDLEGVDVSFVVDLDPPTSWFSSEELAPFSASRVRVGGGGLSNVRFWRTSCHGSAVSAFWALHPPSCVCDFV
jgi:hypothetical protein